MMSCDARTVGMPRAVMCEYTKAYVRCFPLLAVLVSLIVAGRMLVVQRMYYKLLTHHAILDFDPVRPGKDVLFLILVWSAFNAFLHFPLELSVEHPPVDPDMLKLQIQEKTFQGSEKVLFEEIHKMASLYVLPSLIFLAFLWTAYDIEARFLPLSKYVEDDPEQARRLLSNICFIYEDAAAHIVKKKRVEFQHANGRTLTSEEVFAQFVKQCALRSGSNLVRMQSEDAKGQFSHVHLVSAMWPGMLLLDHRLADKSSVNFRRFYLGCCTMGIIVMSAIVWLLIQQLWGDLLDISQGQYSDIVSFFVELAHTITILYVGSTFLKNAIKPYIRAIRD